jgi:hypothetical protein
MLLVAKLHRCAGVKYGVFHRDPFSLAGSLGVLLAADNG